MNSTQKKKLRRVRVAVVLTDSDIAFLKSTMKNGMRKAREITRAHILLMSHKKKSNREIMDALGCSQFAISDLRRRFVKRDRDVATTIVDAARSGTPRKVLPIHEAFIVATACTKAPAGHAHWTTKALKAKLLEAYADLKTVSDEAVRKILLKNKLKPGREKNVVRSAAHPRFSRVHGRYFKTLHGGVAGRTRGSQF